MNFDQLTKRYEKMFPDHSLAEDTRSLWFDTVHAIDGEDADEIFEKFTFAFVISVCQQVKEDGDELVDDLTDALLDVRRQIVEIADEMQEKRQHSFTVKLNLFVKEKKDD